MSNLNILETGITVLNLRIDLLNFYGKLFGVRAIKKTLAQRRLREATEFQRAYVEPGMKVEWIQEDEDYARQCADEKWRSNHE